MRLKHIVPALMICLLAVLFTIVPASAQMALMSDEDLEGVYATGFSTFSVTNGVANATFNVNAAIYADIDSIKLGYHDEYDYKDPNPGFGWDEDWTGAELGTSSQDLVLEGVYIEAKFTNIDNPATRQLEYVKIGFTNVNGDISADFNSFSGYIDDSDDGTPEVNGHGLNLGSKTITSTNSEFYMKLSASGASKGWTVYFDKATVN